MVPPDPAAEAFADLAQALACLTPPLSLRCRAEQLLKFCIALCTEHKYTEIAGRVSIVVDAYNKAAEAAATQAPPMAAVQMAAGTPL